MGFGVGGLNLKFLEESEVEKAGLIDIVVKLIEIELLAESFVPGSVH